MERAGRIKNGLGQVQTKMGSFYYLFAGLMKGRPSVAVKMPIGAMKVIGSILGNNLFACKDSYVNHSKNPHMLQLRAGNDIFLHRVF